MATRGTELGERIAGLEAAVDAARGRLDEQVLAEAMATVERTTGRLRLSARHTVIGIAGATGSGKSSTYNALVGLELSSIGVRRPTTSWATAVVWGSEGAAELLEWLGIPPRHQTMRDSLLDARRDEGSLDGVVLMDLPDHDSTEVAHHLEVDRLVELADLLVWVVDPQKYADAALHDRYLKPLAGHQDVMVIAVNHIDTIPADERDALVGDVRQLLVEDGLDRVTVMPISAKEGLGMDALRAEINARVDSKRATAAKVEADVAAAADKLAALGGDAPMREVEGAVVDDLRRRVEEAAGVPVVVDAVERSVGARVRRATTWPPLMLLGNGKGELADELAEAGVELDADSVPRIGAVDHGAVRTAARDLADEVAGATALEWRSAVTDAAVTGGERAAETLDATLPGVDLRAARLPAWAGFVRVVQWLALLGAVGGAGWWIAGAVGATEDPDWFGVPAGAVVLVGCLVLGLLLMAVGRAGAGREARARGQRAGERLRSAVADELDGSVVQPVVAASADYRRFRSGLVAARRTA
ncbi:GTPase [Nocardioides sambongensis]|uniref:GTPase n=1 Tax=Nocardioides sambongensis TaxID=2589074 RepID=UPI0038B2D1F5